MSRMFEEGARQISSGTAWRDTPPLLGLGESILARSGTNLTHLPQGPPMPARRPVVADLTPDGSTA